MHFCKGCDYGEKVDLRKGYWNPKRKMWVSPHLSEIIDQPLFQKKRCGATMDITFGRTNLEQIRKFFKEN